jgi:hypothetical protein
MEFASWLKVKGVGFEKVQRIDRRGVVARAVEFLRIFIMPHACQVAKQFTRRNGLPFRG